MLNFYVSEVTLSISDNIKFLQNIKQGFPTKISWNKYRSEIRARPKNNKFDYMIDPMFKNISRLFALSFKNVNNDPMRDSSDKFSTPLVY